MSLDLKPIDTLVNGKNNSRIIVPNRLSTREDIKHIFEKFIYHFKGENELRSNDHMRFAGFVNDNYLQPIPEDKDTDISRFVIERNKRVYATTGINSCDNYYWNCLYSTALLAYGFEQMGITPKIFGSLTFEPHPCLLAEGFMFSLDYHTNNSPKNSLCWYPFDEELLELNDNITTDLTPFGEIDGIYGLSLLEFYLPLYFDDVHKDAANYYTLLTNFMKIRSFTRDYEKINSEWTMLRHLVNLSNVTK